MFHDALVSFAERRAIFMKVLVISDIHANSRALEKMLREEEDYDM